MIEISHLTKQYGGHTAVADLNFTIEPGKIYGFLGPNGAGKSTTMNIITGCLSATEGQVKVGGHDIFDEPEKAKRLIGYLPEQPPLYMDMTPREYLHFVADAKGVKREDRQRQMDYVIGVTQIDDVKDRLIKNLSKGYRQRVGIAQALLGEPEVIILDEPTVGLDPIQIIEVRDLIKELGRDHTVILSSHILSEVQEICDSIIIISRGELVASDTPENLESQFVSNTLELLVRATDYEVGAALKGLDGVLNYEYRNGKEPGQLEVRIEMEKERNVSEAVFFAFARAQRPILRMGLSHASLEDVFLELTQEKDPVLEPEAQPMPAAMEPMPEATWPPAPQDMAQGTEEGEA